MHILTKEDYWSASNQAYPYEDDGHCTNETIKQHNKTTPKQLTELYLEKYDLHLVDVLEKTVETRLKEYKSFLWVHTLCRVIHGKQV